MNRRDFIQKNTLAGLAVVTAQANAHAAPISPQDDTRLYWSKLLYKIAEPVLKNLSEGTLQKNWQVEFSPAWDNRNAKVAYLEGFARTMVGIAPWLALPDDTTEEGKLLKQLRNYAIRSIQNSVDPAHADYMLWRKESQTLVDAAFLAQSFLKAPEALWKPLDDTTKKHVVEEFRLLRRVVPGNNNWLLFASIIEVFLLFIGEEADRFRIEFGLRKIEDFYVGDGWFKDGEVFHMDYYNSFVIHPMIVDVLDTMLKVQRKQSPDKKNQNLEDQYTKAVKRMQRQADFLERLISPEGSFPPFGRSITYRTGAFQALTHTALLHQLPEGVSPAQVRCALTAVMKRMFSQDGVFDKAGWLSLGFAGHQPGIADSYSNAGSMYLTTLGFLPLGLPATDPFWADADAEWTQQKAWSGKPFKKDKAVSF
ncbi:DUF2264 domain-containing protein [Emticicia agri]|uniref:DUF2264 domain-containing protein n=1 Tax=Emticicia agri TaxID=2492393 RepID=A0A4Q5M5D9_9BACT|nr:DUF2264 domain-containing protein [Emticicia agri]RYU97621.1 DUF2264 domain-containing protein [Emticicia agri]